MMDFATFAPMDIKLDSDDEMSMDDPMDWENFASVGPMDFKSDLDDDMSIDDPMDWEDSDSCTPMVIDDPMDGTIYSFANLLVSNLRCPSSSSFTVNEHRQLVRCSPWLAAGNGSTRGSIYLPSTDKRYL
jgi:hypothetical protein